MSMADAKWEGFTSVGSFGWLWASEAAPLGSTRQTAIQIHTHGSERVAFCRARRPEQTARRSDINTHCSSSAGGRRNNYLLSVAFTDTF